MTRKKSEAERQRPGRGVEEAAGAGLRVGRDTGTDLVPDAIPDADVGSGEGEPPLAREPREHEGGEQVAADGQGER